MTETPVIGSILLASTDPARLRDWYEEAFGVTANADGFLRFGAVAVLIDRRDDVAPSCAEPSRVILNLHVPDARATAARLNALGVTWVSEVEYRETPGAWFGTLSDPDGNHVQIIELTGTYWSTRGGLLTGADVATRLPAVDLDRARRFYAEKLGLEPVETRPGGLRYECAGGSFAIFASQGRSTGEFTQMGWKVDDIEAVAAELRARGVVFEEVDVPGLRTVGGIATVDGNYPSAGGTGERAVWFRDSEGNMIGLGQAL